MQNLIKQDLLYTQIRRGLSAYHRAKLMLGEGLKYDVILSHEVYCSGLAGLHIANQCQGAPLKLIDCPEYPVWSERSSAQVRNMGTRSHISDGLTTLFAINVINLYDYVFTTSNGQLSTLKKYGMTSQGSVLKNCRLFQNIEKGRYLKDRFGIKDSDIVMLYSNRAYQYAGAEYIIKALTELDNKFKLVFLGDILPEVEPEVNELINANSLSDRVFLTGMVDPSLVLPITHEADICLSLMEPVIDNHRTNLPNRLFDAIMARKPVMAFKDTEIAEFITDNDIGLVFPNKSPVEMARTIKKVLIRGDYFKQKIDKKATEFKWEREKEILLNAIKKYHKSAQNALIVAMKDISRNDRIYRLTETLVDNQMDVDIVSDCEPMSSIKHPNVNYYAWKDYRKQNIKKKVTTNSDDKISTSKINYNAKRINKIKNIIRSVLHLGRSK